MVRLMKKHTAYPRRAVVGESDCGLKTRGWPEVKEALTKMVEAARQLRVEALQKVG